MESFLKNNEYILKAIGVIVAAAFALIEYTDYRQDLRVQKTINIYENLYLKSVQPARASLEQLMYSPATRKKMESLLFSRSEPEETQLKWQQLTIGIVDNANLDSVLIEYVEFFDVLQTCIDARLCDAETARVLFGTNPRDKILMQNYCAYVGYLRAIWKSPTFGEKARIFTNSKCDPSSSFKY